ncbi:hypothetical protein HUJ04_010089 [Dendroctonus ponderosae]|nr:hypothetical protein HUJ04_010089 [Dendroctonus ponderosae]
MKSKQLIMYMFVLTITVLFVQGSPQRYPMCNAIRISLLYAAEELDIKIHCRLRIWGPGRGGKFPCQSFMFPSRPSDNMLFVQCRLNDPNLILNRIRFLLGKMYSSSFMMHKGM